MSVPRPNSFQWDELKSSEWYDSSGGMHHVYVTLESIYLERSLHVLVKIGRNHETTTVLCTDRFTGGAYLISESDGASGYLLTLSYHRCHNGYHWHCY